MKKHVEQLMEIAQKEQRTIIGLMSGTSLDGLDIAVCKCVGAGLDTTIEVAAFTTVPYTPQFKEQILPVFSKKSGDIERLVLLNSWIGMQHAQMINTALQQWGLSPHQIDLIASHGQTLYHAPALLHGQAQYGNATLQLGDGDHIAMATGIITLSDFRQKHIAAGGEGAPLAVYGDFLIFSKPNEDRVMLNMGGIANFTWLPGSCLATEVFSTDTGTGNTLMDAYVQKHFPGKYFDENAAIATEGKVIPALLDVLLDYPFFQATFPKTIGPELFNLQYLDKAMATAGVAAPSHADVLATLCMFSAVAIANAILATVPATSRATIYTSGGGMHNPLMVHNIATLLPGMHITTTQELGIHPDAKEAVLFALLANECVAGSQQGPGNAAIGIPAVSMGKISFPA